MTIFKYVCFGVHYIFNITLRSVLMLKYTNCSKEIPMFLTIVVSCSRFIYCLLFQSRYIVYFNEF